MTPTAPATAAECIALCRYLSSAMPSVYVMDCYERLRPSVQVNERTGSALIERSLLASASLGPIALRAADGYARVFRPRSLLRRRLILLLAILENSPPTERLLNSSDERSFLGVGLRLAGTMMASVLCTLVGTVLLGPIHVVSTLGPAE